MTLISYLIIGIAIISGVQILRSALREKSPKEKLREFAIKQSDYMTQKERTARIYAGIMLLILSLIVLLKSV